MSTEIDEFARADLAALARTFTAARAAYVELGNYLSALDPAGGRSSWERVGTARRIFDGLEDLIKKIGA